MDNDIKIIYSDFFYYYKSGFNNGKEDAFNIIYGNVDTTDKAYYIDDSWDSLGYRDAYDFYSNIYNLYRDTIPLDIIIGIKSLDILFDFYLKRIAEYNKTQNEEISAMNLILLPKHPKEYQK